MAANPPRSPLTRELVVTTAVALADEAGIPSMRALGQALGVEAMSLYHHVANKEALLDGMVDAVFAEVDLPDPTAPWPEAMADRCRSLRAALGRHPWAIALMDSRTSPGPATMAHHDAVLGCLRGAGFSVALAAHAFSLLDAYTFGFAVQEAALPAISGEEAADLVESILAQHPMAEYPHLAELTREHVLAEGYDYATEFDWGLDLLLDGLARRLGA